MERIADWGVLEGEIAVYGGVYSNLAAFEAFCAATADLQPQSIINTGDIVAYCADAHACVEAVRAAGHRVIGGNCETQLAADALDCGCGFEEGTVCDRLSAAWYAHANAEVTGAQRGWMGRLPDWAVFTHGGQRCLVVHGAPSANNRFLWSVTPPEEMEREVRIAQAKVGPVDRIFAGHSGIPFDRALGPARWINGGALGLPPHDGGTATRYLRTSADGTVRIEHLDYDPAPAVAAMEAAGLVQGYHHALTTGLWPSEDVLPQALRRTAV